MSYSMGIDLNLAKPSVITLVDKSTKKLVFSKIYTVSLIEPIVRVKQHFVEYEDVAIFHNAACRGLVFEYLPNGWSLHMIGDKRTVLIERVKHAIENKHLVLPFSGGWAAIKEYEHLAYALAWFGVNFKPIPISIS